MQGEAVARSALYTAYSIQHIRLTSHFLPPPPSFFFCLAMRAALESACMEAMAASLAGAIVALAPPCKERRKKGGGRVGVFVGGEEVRWLDGQHESHIT
jgi:hypothetical protein